MRLNIEWIAPWRFGKPLKDWAFRVHGKIYLGPTWGIWLLGFYIHWTTRCSRHGIGFNVQF